jgi:UDP-N-acetylenolpyruvoylglucosamine reductase
MDYRSEYGDIDKAMCFITGRRYEEILTISSALQREFNNIGTVYRNPPAGKARSTFFHLKFYMKGTLHIEFRDEKLWEEFNLRACKGKNWLPESDTKTPAGELIDESMRLKSFN